MPTTYRYMKELLTCPICQKQFQTLNSHIHFKHHLTTEEFLRQHPNIKLVSDSIKKTVSKSCKKSGCGKWRKGSILSDEQKENLSEMFSGKNNPFFGKKHSKKTRKKMSDNHADFTGIKNPLTQWLEKDSKNRELYSDRMKRVWDDPIMREKLSIRNKNSVAKAILRGNLTPYSKCKHGWYISKKFSCRFYYQSSYEFNFLEFCEQSNKISSLQKVNFMIPYIGNDKRSHNYFPDFIVNGVIVVEIKPKSMLNYNNNKLKIESGKLYCENNGYDYKLLMEEELRNLESILWTSGFTTI